MRASRLAIFAVWLFAALPAQAQPAQPMPAARVVVIGEGSVSVAPDYARLSGGVATRAKTVKEATDANSKLMNAVTAALLDSGIAQQDIQTSRFSIQPVYAPPQPQTEPRLTGYSVSNQVSVTVRQIAKLGETLDRMVAAGATDVGNVAFLIADPSKALDQAREAAVADARRKAELYARASGLNAPRRRLDHGRFELCPAGADGGNAGRSCQRRGADRRGREHAARPHRGRLRDRALVPIAAARLRRRFLGARKRRRKRAGPGALSSERAVMVKGTNRESLGGAASFAIRNAVSNRTISISASMVATFLFRVNPTLGDTESALSPRFTL